MCLHFSHHVLELFFESFEYLLVILLDEYWFFLGQQVCNAIEGGPKSLIEKLIGISLDRSWLIELLLLKGGLWLEGNFANVVV